MARDDQQPDYATALHECGFDARGVARGLQMLESDRYFGFADVVSSLPIEGCSAVQRQPVVESVVRRVAAEEVRHKLVEGLSARRSAGSAAWDVREAEKAAQESEDLRRRYEASRLLSWIGENATDREFDGGPMRKEIAEAWAQWHVLSGLEPPEYRPVRSFRPVDEVEAPLTPAPAAEAQQPVLDTSERRIVRVAESLQDAFGLSPEAARRAAEGR